MFIEQQSVVNCINCTFTNNFAVEGGVVATFDDGYFIFKDSSFKKNIAIAGLIANMYSSTTESSIFNSQITNNQFVDSSTIMSEINED